MTCFKFTNIKSTLKFIKHNINKKKNKKKKYKKNSGTQLTIQKQLYYCSGLDDVTKVEDLLAQGGEPNGPSSDFSQSTPLHRAAWKGNLPIVQLLYSKGGDLNALNKYFLSLFSIFYFLFFFLSFFICLFGF